MIPERSLTTSAMNDYPAQPVRSAPARSCGATESQDQHHQQQNALPLRRPVIRQMLRKTSANATATPVLRGDLRRLIKGFTRPSE